MKVKRSSAVAERGIRVGTDIVFIPRLAKSIRNEAFLKRVFHTTELKDLRLEHLAGLFAAKEAFFKACGKRPKWLEVEVKKKKSGQPYILWKGKEYFLSISHDHEYAIAMVVVA